ncbi:MAG: hypothetical protein MUC85_11560, partial [Anaerolineales bacterium]|nr:hypothetical protein [Anaerolineales bacterium]
MSTPNAFVRMARRALRLAFILCLLVAMFSVNVIPATATDVGGLIDVDTTWTLAGSPYVVVSPVLVSED